ncbi:hypothetical protein MY3957_008713 [Beauveria namnaoensis]
MLHDALLPSSWLTPRQQDAHHKNYPFTYNGTLYALKRHGCDRVKGKSTRGAELKKLPELGPPRRVLAYLLPARSQHGNFTEYRERFPAGQATLECLYRH